MQFLVPQFVEVEDKIVGPLTLRQFLYLAAGGGISFFFFFILQAWLWFIFSAVFVGGAVALAFVRVNGRPLTKIILSAVSFYWQPQTYVWQPDRPKMPKGESALRETAPGFSLENIIAGLSLKKAWQNVQTGTRNVAEEGHRQFQRARENYEIIQKITGERRAARRVDYR